MAPRTATAEAACATLAESLVTATFNPHHITGETSAMTYCSQTGDSWPLTRLSRQRAAKRYTLRLLSTKGNSGQEAMACARGNNKVHSTNNAGCIMQLAAPSDS